jgi:hypothetical protein
MRATGGWKGGGMGRATGRAGRGRGAWMMTSEPSDEEEEEEAEDGEEVRSMTLG